MMGYNDANATISRVGRRHPQENRRNQLRSDAREWPPGVAVRRKLIGHENEAPPFVSGDKLNEVPERAGAARGSEHTKSEC